MIEPTLPGRRAFIFENTRLQAPPHAPELILHLAAEITRIAPLRDNALEESSLDTVPGE